MSRIENGYANPTLNAMEVIANALGLTVFELFDRVKAGYGRRSQPQSSTTHTAVFTMGKIMGISENQLFLIDFIENLAERTGLDEPCKLLKIKIGDPKNRRSTLNSTPSA